MNIEETYQIKENSHHLYMYMYISDTNAPYKVVQRIHNHIAYSKISHIAKIHLFVHQVFFSNIKFKLDAFYIFFY